MDDPRLERHRLGFPRASDPPSVEELQSYYEKTYFQTQRGNYRHSYSEDELKYIDLKIVQRAARAQELTVNGSSSRRMDVHEPLPLLESLKRLVSEDGMLVVTVPNDGCDLQEDLLACGDIPDRFWVALPDHLTYFSAASLRRAAVECGWSCRDILADFPIHLFLLVPGSNYVVDKSQGVAARRARIRAELLLADQPSKLVNDYYSAMVRVGLGRQLTGYLTPDYSS